MEHEYLFVYSRLKLLIKDAHKSFNQVERELRLSSEYFEKL